MIDDLLENMNGLNDLVQYLECDADGIPTGRLKKDTPKEIRDQFLADDEIIGTDESPNDVE